MKNNDNISSCRTLSASIDIDTHLLALRFINTVSPEQYKVLKSKIPFPELHFAIIYGFTHDFQLLTDGTVRLLSFFKTDYRSKDVLTSVITSTISKASLYLISTYDGLFAGTAVEYWETYSE